MYTTIYNYTLYEIICIDGVAVLEECVYVVIQL